MNSSGPLSLYSGPAIDSSASVYECRLKATEAPASAAIAILVCFIILEANWFVFILVISFNRGSAFISQKLPNFEVYELLTLLVLFNYCRYFCIKSIT